MLDDGDGVVAVGGGIDAVQAAGQDRHGARPMLEGGTVGRDIDAIGQSAHDHEVGQALGQVGDERVTKADAILRGTPCPNDADDVGALQVTVAQGVNHRRRVGGLGQAVGIILVGKIGGADAVAGHKGRLTLGPLQAVAAVVVTVNLAAATGQVAQLTLAHGEKALLAAHDVEQLAGQVHTHALHVGKRYAVNE